MSNRSHVLFIVPNLNGGGAQRVILTVLANLDRRRFLPSITVVSPGGVLSNAVPSDIECIELGINRIRRSFRRIVSLVRERKPNVVLSTHGHLNLLLTLARPLLPAHVRLIGRETNIPSINNKNQPFPYLFHIFYKFCYPRLDTVICQSNDMQRDLIRHFRVPKNLTTVIHNPVDVKRVQSNATDNVRIDWPDGRGPKILAVGKLRVQKGFDMLLRAMSKINHDWRLAILGEGPERKRLECLSYDLGIAQKVALPGFQLNPFAWMHSTDLFVLSSRFEGFPNVVLEANACGVPVVAFNCPGGIDEMIVDGLNGFKVSPNSIKELAEGIVKASKTEFDADRIKAHIRDKYDVGKIIKEYEALFMNVIQQQAT